jgi:hypothetical protein
MRPPQELLYESESSLRLVDKAIEELGTENGGAPDVSGFERLQQTLSRAASLVEQLDAAPTCSNEDRHEVAASLREELSSLSTHLHAVTDAILDARTSRKLD